MTMDMNLRSIFTTEQQDTLERFYSNGMTNQSKSCFQLILQCAQETKLDFSVVRTWVGNKRRKLASAVDQNGGVACGQANQMLSGGGRGAVLVTELPPACSVEWDMAVARLLPPVPSPPSFPPIGGGNKNLDNNKDVIVTGFYSLGRTSGPPEKAETLPAEVEPRHTSGPDIAPLHSKMATLPPRVPLSLPASDPPLHVYSGGASRMPQTWVKQHTLPPRDWPSSGTPPPTTLGAAQPGPRCRFAEIRTRMGRVCTPAAQLGGDSSGPGVALGGSSVNARPADAVGCLSIAMETGDIEDEYAREEELARMGAQIQICPAMAGDLVDGTSEPSTIRHRVSLSGAVTDIYERKTWQKPSSSSYCPPRPPPHPGLRSLDSHSSPFSQQPQQVVSQGPESFQASGDISIPWIISNPRKRTLQDRTQFSDGEVHTMKRYWESGMTSPGLVCREKISAVSAELSVDTDIVKTWIGNRRRKCRLMGIRIPPPKDGPAVFNSQPEAASPHSTTAEADITKGPEPGEDSERVDKVSVCLSAGSTGDDNQREERQDREEEMDCAALEDSVKIEIVSDDEDNYGDIIGPDTEKVRSLLEYKNEEVQFLEGELENQRQKYNRLQTFTKNLLSTIKNQDKERQQDLLSSLLQEVEEECKMSPEGSVIASHSYYSVSEVKGSTAGSRAGEAAEGVGM